MCGGKHVVGESVCVLCVCVSPCVSCPKGLSVCVGVGVVIGEA